MKVKDLLAKLKTLPDDLDVLCYTEDEDLVPEGQGFRLFDITAVSVTDAVGERTEHGVPYLRLGKSPHSRSFVLVEVTGDF